jgi:hypothetical protein
VDYDSDVDDEDYDNKTNEPESKDNASSSNDQMDPNELAYIVRL